MTNHFCEAIKQDSKEQIKLINNIKKGKIVICTWGICGKLVYKWCEENHIRVSGIVDNDSKKWGKPVFDIKVESFDSIKSNSNTYYVIATYNQYLYNDIYQQLIHLGIDNLTIIHVSLCENYLFKYRFDYKIYLERYSNPVSILENMDLIEKVAGLLNDNQSKEIYYKMLARHYNCYECTIPEQYCGAENYFDWEFFSYTEHETLIQCGVMDGATIKDFIKLVPNYNQIIGIEADYNNYMLASRCLNTFSRVDLINKAIVEDDSIEVAFCSFGTGRSHIESLGDIALEGIRDNDTMGEKKEKNITVKAIKGDNLSVSPTFIQMDIEGAEMMALKGFERTIISKKPKLAICIYHSIEDFWNIPLYIHKIVPNYKLFVRNGSAFCKNNETVLYATL